MHILWIMYALVIAGVNALPVLNKTQENDIVGTDSMQAQRPGPVADGGPMMGHGRTTEPTSATQYTDLKLGELCDYEGPCHDEGSFCDNGVCACKQEDYVQIGAACRKKISLGGNCEYDEECQQGTCARRQCECIRTCRLRPPNSTPGSGMNGVVMAITACVVVAGVACAVTLLYRRLRMSTEVVRSNGQNGVNLTRIGRMSSVTTVSRIQPTATPDLPPPLYEEVVIEPPKLDPDPPSYNEYLQLQRNSLQHESILTHQSRDTGRGGSAGRPIIERF